MNYHTITYPDQNNGNGLRVVLWLSSCSHHCYNCQNPQTWDTNSGILFDESAKEELFRELDKDYISGITLSGGDPLHENNLDGVLDIVDEFAKRYKETQYIVYNGNENHNILCENADEIRLSSNKTIWLYTGYTWESIMEYKASFKSVMDTSNDEILYDYHMWKRQQIIKQCDVLIDGPYIDSQRDVTLKWRGSSNQRVIDIQKSLEQKQVVLYCE